MNDPHVVALSYQLVFGSNVRYEPPQSKVTYARPDFDIELFGGEIRFLPKAHFADRNSAQVACRPLVLAWEVAIALEVGSLDVKLQYKSTEIVDRNPTPGVFHIDAEAAGYAVSFIDANFIRSLRNYPKAPPLDFLLNPESDCIWQRYRMYKEGREPLLSMAYFILSMLEKPRGGRQSAATTLNIDPAILGKIGKLSSTRGDNLSARKHESALGEALEFHEILWLEKAVENLVIHIGTSPEGRAKKPLLMSDLPAL